MANFVSTQTGNWNDGGTYGNTSPGDKGTDWPGNAGDTVTISVGHTVTYNVSETNELGQIDVAGKLSFSDAASRKLTLAHQNLNIANGGELEIGTSISNFDKTYTAEILWNTTSDNAKGLIIANGGKLTVYGDSTYCSDYEDTLAADAENTDNDVRIKTVTNMSGIWHAGDELTIKVENAGDSTSYQDAIKLGVIQSFEASNVIVLDININAAAGVGDVWISPVVNVTRNVQIGKLNASTAIANYNSNRPKFTDANANGNNNCFFSYAIATGFYTIGSGYDFQSLNSTIRNSNYGFYSGANHTVSGNVYSNYYGFSSGTNYTVSGRIGYNGSDVSAPNITSDIYTNGANKYNLCNAKLPLAGLNVRRNLNGYATRVYCEHHDRTVHAHKIYDNNGDVVKTACDGTGDAPSIDPDGGNDNCIELSNIQSLCNSNNPLIAIEFEKYRIWAITGVEKTYTFKIQTTYAGITAGNLKLTARYLDEVSEGHLGEETNAPAVNQRGDDTDWTQTLAVTVTPLQTGWISFEIKLMEYESGNEVYIWPVVGIA